MKSGHAIFTFVPFAPAETVHAGIHRLVHHGFNVRQFSSLSELSRALQEFRPEAESRAVVIIDGNDAHALSTVAALRTLSSNCRLVALQPHDDLRLVQLLQVGIDMYCPADASPDLLFAVVLCTLRRDGHEPHKAVKQQATAVAGCRSSPDGGGDRSDAMSGDWMLVDQDWVMLSPDGRRIALTTGERAFLSTLLKAPERKASHAALIAAVNAAYNQANGRTHQSRLGVMVSRMRRKFVRQGAPLPLRSIHNWGYMFVTGD